MVEKMKDTNVQTENHKQNSTLGRGLRALALKQSGNTRILRNVKSLASQAQQIGAPAICSKSGTIAL